MTDKAFYQAAAAEVASGNLDSALWIKTCAEMPGTDDLTRQAKYIQLRAKEMAGSSAKFRAASLAPHTGGQWTLYLFLLACITFPLFIISGATFLLGLVIVAAGLYAPAFAKKRARSAA